jgi:hypothetical protein
MHHFHVLSRKLPWKGPPRELGRRLPLFTEMPRRGLPRNSIALVL